MKKRPNSVRLVLTVMLLVISLNTLPHITARTSLLLLCSVLLSIHSLYTMVAKVIATDFDNNNPFAGLGLVSAGGSSDGNGKFASRRPEHYCVRIHSHAFTSPDAPITAPDEEIPKRFIDGCGGDLKEARLRWDTTKHWREKEVSHTVGSIRRVCISKFDDLQGLFCRRVSIRSCKKNSATSSW
jgi:hypothetical protein